MFRPTGTRDDWSCHYSIDSIRQRVPEQTREVHFLWAALDESELEQLVAELRRQLAAHPDIAATAGGIEFFSIHSNDENFSCSFLRGREFWRAAFSDEGEVRLEGLEFVLRLPEDPGATKF